MLILPTPICPFALTVTSPDIFTVNAVVLALSLILRIPFSTVKFPLIVNGLAGVTYKAYIGIIIQIKDQVIVSYLLKSKPGHIPVFHSTSAGQIQKFPSAKAGKVAVESLSKS